MMNKNHFIFPYVGNKRNEIIDFYKYLDFEGITTIIEPFCGSSAMSYYIAQKHPGKFKYILNDNNEILLRLYNTFKDEPGIDKLNEEINYFIDDFNSYEDDKTRKHFYKNKIKEDTLLTYFIKNKICSIRPGLYPLINTKKKIKNVDLRKHGVYDFIKNEDVIFEFGDGIDFYIKHAGNASVMILMDPPYVNSCNGFYDNPKGNIYEYLHDNDIQKNKAKTYLILENIWINKLLFRNSNLLFEYAKTYESSKRKTSHILISN